MKYSDKFVIKSMDGLIKLIDEVGFVPFFANEIDGFSLEEHIDHKCWYNGSDPWEAWEWKGPVIRKTKCAYGKFLKGKAMYISQKWFPDFANFRRDGYDFDARYEDGLASRNEKELYELLDENAPIMSKSLKRIGNYCKNGKKGFDSTITKLQKLGYVVISDFSKAIDRSGQEYGWGIAEYSTPEKYFGKSFIDKVYECTPKESYEKIIKHFKKILPKATEEQLSKILK